MLCMISHGRISVGVESIVKRATMTVRDVSGTGMQARQWLFTRCSRNSISVRARLSVCLDLVLTS